MPPARRSNPALTERLRFLRAEKDLTQQEVVELLVKFDGERITKQAYSEYERGVSAPSRTNLIALERLYGEPEGALRGLVGDDVADRISLLEVEIHRQGRLLAEIAAQLGQDAR